MAWREADADWEGIVHAKNELLHVKDDALVELQRDLERQKALIARLNGVRKVYLSTLGCN